MSFKPYRPGDWSNGQDWKDKAEQKRIERIKALQKDREDCLRVQAKRKAEKEAKQAEQVAQEGEIQ